MLIEVRQTDEFAGWLGSLRDKRATDRITARILRAREGNLGDVKLLGGIGEMRVDYGPGYRLYFVRRGNAVVLLLCGGDKGSQDRDIRRAQKMAREI